MSWYWWLILAYIAGFCLVFLLHTFALQMVTFPLALLRSILWPLWLTTGLPHGRSLPMD